MVLEHLFPEDWLERRARYAFILSFVYSAISIVVARLLFAANSGLVSVVFTSLFLLPYMNRLFKKEEVSELREKRGFKIRYFLKDNWPGIKVYTALFFGVYLSFTIYSFLLPMMGFNIGAVFREQLSLESGIRGGAFLTGTFLNIFFNNWWVLLACFMLALITGDGAIFFITWNASSWGAIFGYRALAAGSSAFDPLINLAIILVFTLPHVFFEGLSYILAAISGSIISYDVLSENDDMPQFIIFLIMVLLGIFFISFVSGIVFSSYIIRGFIIIILSSLVISLLERSFRDSKHRRIFRYNFYLFLIAIIIFFFAAIVETIVLGSSGLLSMIYSAASMA